MLKTWCHFACQQWQMQVAGDLLDLYTDAAGMTMAGTDGRVAHVAAMAKGTISVHQVLSVA